MSKVWFITGTSRGLGQRFAEAALARGDQVAATARDLDTLQDLVAAHGDAVLPLPLDVTDRAAATDRVRRAHEHFGRLDVVVNNAGHIVHGAVEELEEQDLRDQLETNLFGPLWVIQAALPLLRRQGGGRIIQISSLAGVAAYPTLGAYHASKWALEGISESLAGEVAQFGIKVTIVEPGAYSTGLGTGAVKSAPLAEYDHLREALSTGSHARELGDPASAAQALLRIADAENPPLRVVFGAHPYQAARRLYAERLDTWAEWAEVSAQA
ncbi:SDR family NAD(P)-dependent oxidoreductase [Nonomuraea bangladeshensis]|uniref:SDR family NAD(P)-dependent oxidoreductase n=1 Tax=Nonomuraea bangladeshensis TaxID=404385 RepID=UPI0031D32503